MVEKLQNAIKFRSDLLFEGAVNIDWFVTDKRRRKAAAEAFVFHGPKYHGVSQEDIGTTHGHRLQDSASFVRSIVKRCCGIETQPFTIAIAGYGTGKSHLALTLAMLLADPSGATAKAILANIRTADQDIGQEVHTCLKEDSRPFLVVAFNGMRNFDLTAEVTRQVKLQLRERKQDTKSLDDVRPRFGQAANIIRMSKENVIEELLTACSSKSVETILDALDNQDELVYTKVHEFYATKGSLIRALGGESLQDVIETVCREYCGENKPFKHLVVLFDEFGRYTEFATISKQIAGSGVLQDLFEGIQSNSGKASFVGFIQFELNAYVQRVANEYRNEIIRYVTRYDIADKVYLSINLETLMANLLEKQDTNILDKWFDSDEAHHLSLEIARNLHEWFPSSLNHRLWNDEEQFHTVIRKGCWPLSPYSTWFLFHLAAAGKHLQQRSALALLANVLPQYAGTKLPADGNWSLTPVNLWSDQLQEELLNSEESGQQGAIAHAYTSVYNRHSPQLSPGQINTLRAVVLASKLGLRVCSYDEAVEALAAITGVVSQTLKADIEKLQDEYNVLEWDEGFKGFEILGDAVPRTTFLAFLNSQTNKLYDENSRAELFMAKAREWSALLGDLECDFAEKHDITTKEWSYQGVTSNMNSIEMHLRWAALRWKEAVEVDAPRGTIIYCYIERSRDPRSAESEVGKLIRSMSQQMQVTAVPILIVFLYDESGALGQDLAELAVLEDHIKDEDRVRFGNLVPAHQEKTRRAMESSIEAMLKERRYVPFIQGAEIGSQRLTRFGCELFDLIYDKVLPFPFDGFSTARGNAADTCQLLTSDLLSGKIDYDSVISKPAKTKNRAIAVLNDCWQVFSPKDGAVVKRPSQSTVREIINEWDRLVKSDECHFLIGAQLRYLCKPPYGANIASAGLLLGTFIAPRMDKLIVLKNGNQYAISQWLHDGIFKGKFLDCEGLDNIRLAYLGEVASEWTSLFDEWDQAESYLDRHNIYARADELKCRIPIPPIENYRFELLEREGVDAGQWLRRTRNDQDEALSKIARGAETADLGLISWGASRLLAIADNMRLHTPRWTKEQIEEFDSEVVNAKQQIIQDFSTWLRKQSLNSTNPALVGDFKHRMMSLVGGNLIKLDLKTQYDELEKHVNALVRDSETAAASSQLIRDVRSWLQLTRGALRIIRVAEIRGLIDVCKNFKAQLQDMAKRTKLIDLTSVDGELTGFQTKLDGALSEAMDRGSRIWDSEIRTGTDIHMLVQEVNVLTSMFEGCDTDLCDLRAMADVLTDYERTYRQLQEDTLTLDELNRIVTRAKENIKSTYKDASIPWDIDGTFTALITDIEAYRSNRSHQWIKDMESELNPMDGMPVGEANRLFDRASNPPAYLTDQDAKRLVQMKSRIEHRLNSLVMEWLIQKFMELPMPEKKRFLKLAKEKLVE